MPGELRIPKPAGLERANGIADDAGRQPTGRSATRHRSLLVPLACEATRGLAMGHDGVRRSHAWCLRRWVPPCWGATLASDRATSTAPEPAVVHSARMAVRLHAVTPTQQKAGLDRALDLWSESPHTTPLDIVVDAARWQADPMVEEFEILVSDIDAVAAAERARLARAGLTEPALGEWFSEYRPYDEVFRRTQSARRHVSQRGRHRGRRAVDRRTVSKGYPSGDRRGRAHGGAQRRTARA